MKYLCFIVLATIHFVTSASTNGAACLSHSNCEEITVDTLRSLGTEELDALFANGDGTRLPEGELRGAVLFSPGTAWGRILGSLSTLVWKGKYFNSKEQQIKNLISPFGFRLVSGDLHIESGLDGKPSIIVTYSESLGDEIRWIGSNVLLGRGVNSNEYGVYFYMVLPD